MFSGILGSMEIKIKVCTPFLLDLKYTEHNKNVEKLKTTDFQRKVKQCHFNYYIKYKHIFLKEHKKY